MSGDEKARRMFYRLAMLPALLLLDGMYEIWQHWTPKEPCARLFSDGEIDTLAGRAAPAADVNLDGQRCTATWGNVVVVQSHANLDAIAAAWEHERGFTGARAVEGLGVLGSFDRMGSHQRRLLVQQDGTLTDVQVTRDSAGFEDQLIEIARRRLKK